MVYIIENQHFFREFSIKNTKIENR